MSDFIRLNNFPLNPEVQTTASQEIQATAGQEKQKRTETTAIILVPVSPPKPPMSMEKKMMWGFLFGAVVGIAAWLDKNNNGNGGSGSAVGR